MFIFCLFNFYMDLISSLDLFFPVILKRKIMDMKFIYQRSFLKFFCFSSTYSFMFLEFILYLRFTTDYLSNHPNPVILWISKSFYLLKVSGERYLLVSWLLSPFLFLQLSFFSCPNGSLFQKQPVALKFLLAL